MRKYNYIGSVCLENVGCGYSTFIKMPIRNSFSKHHTLISKYDKELEHSLFYTEKPTINKRYDKVLTVRQFKKRANRLRKN